MTTAVFGLTKVMNLFFSQGVLLVKDGKRHCIIIFDLNIPVVFTLVLFFGRSVVFAKQVGRNSKTNNIQLF